MKYLFLSLFLFLYAFSGCKSKDPVSDEMNVSGDIHDYKEGKVVLCKVEKGAFVPMDSLYMTKGNFKFEHVKLTHPELLYLVVDNGKLIIEFFGECNRIEIQADTAKSGRVEVLGSKTHDEYLTFMENISVFENKAKEIQKQLDLIKSSGNVSAINELDSINETIVSEQVDFIKKYVGENPGSFVSTYFMSQTLCDMIDLDEYEKLKNNLRDTVKESIYYKNICEFIDIQKHIKPGLQAPDFSLPDSSGRTISLSSLQQNNTILFFGASWNDESKLYLKAFKQIVKQNVPKKIKLFHVFIESDRSEWIKMLKDEKPIGICVSDLKGLQSESIQLYGVRKIPKVLVLDKHGIILGEAQSRAELDALISELR